MTAEGLRLSLAGPHGEGVSESKWGVEAMGGAAEWRNLCSSFVTRPSHGRGGRAAKLAMEDRYRQEIRRQKLPP